MQCLMVVTLYVLFQRSVYISEKETLCIPLVLLLLFMPGNGGTPFNEPSPLLPSDGAPLREDSPPADLDSKKEKNNS